ncbi:MAG: cellulose biosynthesis protein BcsS [Xanthobacteraceae bacterium]
MVALRGMAAAAVAIAGLALVAGADRPRAAGSDNPSFLFFTGTDFWRYGAFLNGGLLWSPAGVDTGGFTFKMLLDGGRYSYVSGGLQQTIDGTQLSAAALPGWRLTRDGLTVTLFAGPLVQDYRLVPNDPGSRLRGFYVGAQTEADIWYQPNALTMASFDGAISSIGPTGYVRGAIGFRLFASAFVGPEVGQFWCANFDEIEFGAHVTALRIRSAEWSLGSGWAVSSDQRSGPYLRLGVSMRY